jgi:hypothetical protein
MQGQDSRFDSGTDDARCSDTQAAAMRREEARSQAARSVASSMGHPADEADRSAESDPPDETTNPAAIKEVSRLRGDVYLVETDLEDQDEREAAPGARDQD